ncbi:hypothetical protein D3C80_1818470 [compost metagenome]
MILLRQRKHVQHGGNAPHFTDTGLGDINRAVFEMLNEALNACGILSGGDPCPLFADVSQTG